MQPNEAMVARALEFFDNSPAYRTLYLSALEFCRERRTESEVIAHIDALRRSASQIRSAGSLVESLVSVGMLEQTILVDGEIYEGTLKELQSDDDVPEDAKVEIFEDTTDMGARVADRMNDVYSVASLVREHPRWMRGFRTVLEACETPDGVSTNDLEGVLKEAGAWETDERTGLPLVYPSYFTSELERVGALEWNGNTWVTSGKGSAALATGDLEDATA